MEEQPAMQFNYLGKTGVSVSKIGLGTMTFGKHKGGPFDFYDTPTHSDEAMAHKLLDRYVELGGNFIDTANVYTAGQSEQVIGNWFQSKRKRDSVVLATKVRFPTTVKDQGNIGLSRRSITRGITESLERLQTHYIDLYQAHLWDNATPVEETLRTLDDLVRCGKIHHYGYSNLCGWQIQLVVDTAKHLGLNPCITLQQQYNLLHRESEWEAFMVCQNEGIGVLPWSPLMGGMLTGKFKREVTPDPEKSRMGYMYSKNAIGQLGAWSTFSNSEQYWTIIDTLQNIASKHEKTVAQVSLKWLLQKKYVASLIVGATSIQQLECNMAAGSDWEITQDEMESLDKASFGPKTYPYDMLWNTRNAGRYNGFHGQSVKIPEASI